MRFVGICLNVERDTVRVDRRLEQNQISGLELFSRAVERQFLQACEAGEDANNAVAAVVAIADGDALGVEEGECSVEGGEAGGVGETVAAEQRGGDGFEATVVGC